MDSYSEIEHIKRIKEYLLPKMEGFAASIDGLMKDNTKVKECIIKFDNTICNKANKAEIYTMKHELIKTFID